MKLKKRGFKIMETITALNFFKDIEKEQKKYKLVNGLFIVKYLDDETSILKAEFLKSNSVFNLTKTNKIKIINSSQLFNKNKNLTRINGFWKKLNISFKEQNIKEVLK
jgi:hypothetical protein